MGDWPKPPWLADCPHAIPKLTRSRVKAFVPTEGISRVLGSAGELEQNRRPVCRLLRPPKQIKLTIKPRDSLAKDVADRI